MRDETHAPFQTLRQAIDVWSRTAGHYDAYVRGSQARKDLAEQIVRYRKWLGKRQFIELLRNRLPKE
ncbi:MAG: hypothetical protein K8R36_14995 [Planctomycetales bacterium]|nr:hypothetical protein [Planctomycetales bacterium]